MKKHAYRVACLLLSLLLFLPLLPATAFAADTTPDTSAANAVYFFHVESGSILHTQNENELLPAASTVKILSGLILCEALSDRLEETVPISSDMIAGVAGYRSKFLKAGVTVTVRELLFCALCASYNDAYQILAYLVTNGSPSDFVSMMRLRAKELGLTQSVFNDLIGTSDSSFTTAAEMATIAKVAYQNGLYLSLCSTEQYRLSSVDETVRNRNEMVRSTETYKHHNDYANGMNVGSTANGGDCIVASANNGRESYICVVLGCTEAATVDQNQAYSIANALINWVYSAYVDLPIITTETVLCTLPVRVSDVTTKIEIKSDREFSYYLPSSATVGEDIRLDLRLDYDELEAPVKAGMHVGYVAVLYKGEQIGSVPLYTAGEAERSSFVSSLKAIQALTRNRPFMAGVIFFTVGLVSWITAECLLTRHRHRKWNKYFSHKIDTTKTKKQGK